MSVHALKSFYIWGVKLVIFIIPFLSLYISSGLYFPYITGRNFWFRILIEVALVLWLGLVFLDKTYRPKLSPLLLALIAFLVIVGAADLLGVNFYNSFWSRYERMEGYLIMLHLAAYFLMATTVLRTKKDWGIVLNIFVIAGAIVGLYGLLQKLGYFRAIQGGFRIDGTIGNPTYFAAYLLLVVAITGLLAVTARLRWLRWTYIIGTVFFLALIYFAASRGPILALFAAALLWSVLYIIFVKTKNKQNNFYKKIAAGFLFLIVVFPIIFWLFRETNFVKNSQVLSRFSADPLAEKTTRARFMIWGVAWEGFKERPILGWGQENYLDVFTKHYNPYLYDQEPWFDRAHNIVFDWLVNAGILGLMAYLSLFITAFITLWRVFKIGIASFAEASILFTTLIAYFIQNLFVFDNFNTYILFFILLAYINYLRSGLLTSEQRVISDINKNKDISLAVAAGALVLIIPVIYFVNIRPIQQSHALIKALQSVANQSGPDYALTQFKGVLAYNTFGNGETREQFGRMAISLAESASILPEKKMDFIKIAFEEMEKQVERFPGDLKTHLFLANLYHRLVKLDNSYFSKARAHIDTAMRLSPARQTVYFLLADNYLLASDFNNALDVLHKAVVLAPIIMESQVNLAKIAIYAGREDVIRNIIKEIRRLDPNETDAFAKIGDYYVQVRNFSRALELYELALSINPFNADYNANIAGIYIQLGRKDDAIKAANKAAKYDPAEYAAKVVEFLKYVESR